MANTIKIKRSAVAGKAPAVGDLQLGELAINTFDGKLYTKKDNGTASVVEIGAGGGAAGPVLQYDTSLAENVTLSSGFNGVALDDVAVEGGYTLEVPDGQTFTIGSFDAISPVSAGAGLTQVGSALDVGTASSSRIVVNTDNIDLAATGVSAGTYTSVTVDTYGRVTAGTSSSFITDAPNNGLPYVRQSGGWSTTPIRYATGGGLAIGGALNNTTTSAGLIGIGSSALAANTTGNRNIAVGDFCQMFTTSGSDNTAIGYQSLYANTTGYQNTIYGAYAGQNISTGFNNVAIGYLSLNRTTTGDQNIAVGKDTLYWNTTGYWNTAVGSRALISNTTGYMGTSVGFESLFYNQTGLYNTAFGFRALHQATNNSNTGIGTEAGFNITTGANNTCIGIQAGTDAVANLTTQSNYVVLGNNSTANANIKVAWTVTSDARDKCRIAPCPHGLAFVASLAPVRYEYRQSRESEQPITDGRPRYGFLAQDVLALEGDDAVIIDDRDPDSLKFTESSLIPVLVNAIQELSAQVSALTTRVAALEAI